MSFKIGDKVRIISDDTWFKRNKLYNTVDCITRINDIGNLWLKRISSEWAMWIYPNEVELSLVKDDNLKCRKIIKNV
jgi:hypothetical protein